MSVDETMAWFFVWPILIAAGAYIWFGCFRGKGLSNHEWVAPEWTEFKPRRVRLEWMELKVRYAPTPECSDPLKHLDQSFTKELGELLAKQYDGGINIDLVQLQLIPKD